jgi:hypothetical protein
MLLVLTVLVHLRQGSTRICLRDLTSWLLKRITPTSGTISLEPVQVVELIETLIDSHRLGTVVGRAKEFKPLIVCGDYLYLQKMLYLED